MARASDIPATGDLPQRRSGERLTGIDALRGIAALSVVLFHYTTHFVTLFQPSASPAVSFPGGHFGVNLFFIISGFVIFMTLENTRRPLDFVVSRFSRLYPAYWVAVLLTFSVTHLLGLPGKLVGPEVALANLLMFHGLFRVPHVDSVYWTLEVELLFYCGMLLLYTLGRLGAIHRVLWVLLALRLTYFGLNHAYGIELPWTIYRLLILKFIPWFALGIAVYQLVAHHDADRPRQATLTAAFALITLAVVDGGFVGALAIGLATLVLLAASGRLPLLRHPILVWLGAISYPLYLLHENIGWSLMLRLRAGGLSIDLAILLTLAVSLLLATALNRTVERPAMRWIRERYRRHGTAGR